MKAPQHKAASAARVASTSEVRPRLLYSRRGFLARTGGLLAGLAAGGIASRKVPAAAARGGGRRAAGPAPPLFAFVGCDTTKERLGHGEGLTVYQVDFGAWTIVQVVADLVNPAALALDGQRRCLYVGQGDTGTLTAFAVDPETGSLRRLNQQAAGGRNPAHLAVDPTGRFLVVLDPDPGSVAMLPIETDGSLAPLREMVSLPGASKGTPSAAPVPHHHPLQILFDPSGQFLLVPDPGGDTIFVFRFDSGAGGLLANDPPGTPSRPGAGPCRVAFHPNRPYAYVLNAGNSTITTYDYDEGHGTLTPLQVVSTLPSTFSGTSTAADLTVAPWGTFVYVSNCGHDSIGLFAINPAVGLLAPVSWTASQGRTPRALALDPSGTWLYAANEESDSIVTFRTDPATGELISTGQIVQTGSPAAILFRDRDIRLGRGAGRLGRLGGGQAER